MARRKFTVDRYQEIERRLAMLEARAEKEALIGDLEQAKARSDEAARRAAQFARQRYAAGLVDYTSVATTQQTQITVSDSLKSCEALITTALIQLYKALGGGWSTEDPAAGAAPAKGIH